MTQEYRDEGGSAAGSITVNRGYDDASGRIDTITTSAGGSIQNLDYDFDSLGNLERRQDLLQSIDETFGYDALNRL